RAPIHALGIAVIGKGEMMAGVEPAVVAAAQAVESSAFDHCGVSGVGASRSAYCLDGLDGPAKNDHLRGSALRDARGVFKVRGDEPHPAVRARSFGVQNQHRGGGFRVTLRASPTTRANPVTILRRTILAASALSLL